MALKVYGGCYDGRNRVIVAATSLKAAHEAVSASGVPATFHGYKQYTAVSGNPREVDTAMSAPGTVFSAVNDYRSPFAALSPSGEK